MMCSCNIIIIRLYSPYTFNIHTKCMVYIAVYSYTSYTKYSPIVPLLYCSLAVIDGRDTHSHLPVLIDTNQLSYILIESYTTIYNTYSDYLMSLTCLIGHCHVLWYIEVCVHTSVGNQSYAHPHARRCVCGGRMFF